jgi:murein L,D-transpeptidase YcbB/YkuD
MYRRSLFVAGPITRLAALAGALAVFPAAALQAQAPSGIHVDLNIPTLRLVVSEDGQVLKTYPVSVGQLGHDTPTGTFRISRAEWNPSWRPPSRDWARGKAFTPPGPDNPMGRVKLFFSPLYYIHGTPEVESLGTPASHGCVRMRNHDAVELGRLLSREANPTVPADRITGILARAHATRVSSFRDSVTLVVRYDPVVVEGGELRIYPDIYDRHAVHSEAVYQALLAAGYDVSGVDLASVRAVLKQAKGRKAVLRLPLETALGGLAPKRSPDAAPGRRPSPRPPTSP